MPIRRSTSVLVFRFSSDVAALFEPSIQGIIDAIEQQRQAACTTVSVCSCLHVLRYLKIVTDRLYSPFFLWGALLRVNGYFQGSRSTCCLQGLISAVRTAMCMLTFSISKMSTLLKS